MAEYTMPYVTQIIGGDDPKKGTHLGSGVRCILNGRRCVVTAQHVIEKATQSYEYLAVSTGYGCTPFEFHGEIRMNAGSDVAVCVLPDDYPDDYESHGIAFWPEARIDLGAEARRNEYLFLHGFPGERSRFDEPMMGVSSQSLPYGAMEQVSGLPATARPYNFGLHFDLQHMRTPKGSPAELINAHGLSGCGVWRIGSYGKSAAWQPKDSWLVGVQIEHHAVEKVLLATEIGKALELLRPRGTSSRYWRRQRHRLPAAARAWPTLG